MKAVQVRKAHELIIQEVEKPRISNSTDVLVKVKE